MRKLTGSQRKTKNKQRTLSRRKGRSAYIKLYHGTSPDRAGKIRQTGLRSKFYGDNPYSSSITPHPIHATLTNQKEEARYMATFQNRSPSKRARIRKGRKNSVTMFGIAGQRIKKGSVVTVKLPRKKIHEYLVKGSERSVFGIYKPIPSRYIK